MVYLEIKSERLIFLRSEEVVSINEGEGGVKEALSCECHWDGRRCQAEESHQKEERKRLLSFDLSPKEMLTSDAEKEDREPIAKESAGIRIAKRKHKLKRIRGMRPV